MSANLESLISFIIPAKNEASEIEETIGSIKSLPLSFPYEIIVIDHNSTDNTFKVAEDAGALVVSKVGGTIGEARNFGVSKSGGDVIVFIDADVSLTSQWHIEFEKCLQHIASNVKYITGSHCAAPDDSEWLAKYWFNNLDKRRNTTHLGTGHLIVSKQFFEEIGGFDPNLITGEDYDFCLRARRLNGQIINNDDLKVIHRDYPRTISDFIKRESWHGVGDLRKGTILTSKVALCSFAFIAINISLFLSLFFFTHMFLLVCVILILFLLANSMYKFRTFGPVTIVINSLIFYFYYVGRSLSIVKAGKIFNHF